VESSGLTGNKRKAIGEGRSLFYLRFVIAASYLNILFYIIFYAFTPYIHACTSVTEKVIADLDIKRIRKPTCLPEDGTVQAASFLRYSNSLRYKWL
jgi:hypothetical protein